MKYAYKKIQYLIHDLGSGSIAIAYNLALIMRI